ncbi:MAG: DUF1223 domain-containing protein [Xanthomonadales bacterium]|nr:DUF1223 domain-containing protein [Xanthomonadales bacterium]
MNLIRACLLLICLLPIPAAFSESLVFAAGQEKVRLLELYTSEGCSSCPPADRWLSRWRQSPDLWRTVVPVAFHVDYWDYLGWEDRFARAEFSQRQRAYARRGASRAVYTPGFILDGAEWRGFFKGSSLPPGTQSRPGSLTLTVAAGKATVNFDAAEMADYSVWVAELGTGLTSRVRAGENRGRSLTHDFVVLNLTEGPLERVGRVLEARMELPADPRAGAIAAWVTGVDGLEPVQAVGGFLAAEPP